MRKSERENIIDSGALYGLFDRDVLESVGEFFALPSMYQGSLQYEGGCCQQVECGGGHYGKLA